MIFPGFELVSAIEDQDDEPTDRRKVLHAIALAKEYIKNAVKEITCEPPRLCSKVKRRIKTDR